VSGLLVAGILGATMGSLSSAINSMSNSSITDLIYLFGHRTYSHTAMLRISRVFTLIWAAALVGLASMFTNTNSPAIVLGLSITGYTYGALLGAFMLGLLIKRANQRDGAIAFLVTVIVMAVVVLDVKIDGRSLAFPWFVPIGVFITLVVGGLLSLTHAKAPASEQAVEIQPARHPSPSGRGQGEGIDSKSKQHARVRK
jgi:Na+/proline symporter